MRIQFFKYLTLFLIISTTSILPLKSIEYGSIQIKISGIKELKGELRIAMFNSEKTFEDSENPVESKIITIKEKQHLVVFENVPYGVYGIVVFQDENMNKKLDKNIIGFPTERFGFSNNFRPRSKPKFDKFKFKFNNKLLNLHIDIK